MKYSILLLLFFALISCGKKHNDIPSDANNVSSIESERDTLRFPKILDSSSGFPWKESYSEAIADELLKDDNISILHKIIIIDDLEKIQCENFNNMNTNEKISFFIVYLSSIAEAESDFKNYSKSKAPDGTTNVGLFQIDKKSAIRHGGSKYNDISNDDLEVGETNARIAVNILRNQLRDRKNLLFPRYYWEVLYGEKGFKNFKRHFLLHLDQLNCRSL